jgi:molybdopterin molybdotransferase
MINVTTAETKILDLITPIPETENITLNNALNRILATDVHSNLDFPHWDNSAMDGYAVRFEDVKNATATNPITLNIVEEIPAGYVPKINLKNGEAARIFTGAMLPQGADTIVIQENTIRENNWVKILNSPPKVGDFVRKKGEFYQAGNSLLQAGICLKPADIAVLAAANCANLTVYRQPKIAVFSTGDELVELNQPLQEGQIVDSNQYAIASFIAANGAIPLTLGIVPDNPQALKETISHALNIADFVISTGGVSVGEYDYIDQILAELGGKMEITSVAVKPGKPLTVAKFPQALYFGIPGNPVSALVSCWRFVQPALKKLAGIKHNYTPTFLNATTTTNLKSGGQRETYLWGKVEIHQGEYFFTPAGGSHSSGNLINLAQTNALAIISVGQKMIQQNSVVKIMLINF